MAFLGQQMQINWGIKHPNSKTKNSERKVDFVFAVITHRLYHTSLTWIGHSCFCIILAVWRRKMLWKICVPLFHVENVFHCTLLKGSIKLHSAVGGSASFCPGDKLSSDRDPLVYICSRWGLEAGRNTPYTHHCEFSALEFLALELFALSSSTILTLLWCLSPDQLLW